MYLKLQLTPLAQIEPATVAEQAAHALIVRKYDFITSV